MDDITTRCARLRLSTIEGNEVDLSPPMEESGHVVAGKFCMKRWVNLESVAWALKVVWKMERNFEVSDMGENKVLFKFETQEDMDRVLLQSPWSFDKYLVILHKLEMGDATNRIRFDRASFWVQIHGLPTMSQTKETGLCLGSTLGVVEKVDVDGKGFSLGRYLRICVSLDITKPLCRGRMVRIGGPSTVWVEFKYERLPIFCYWCGKVDHDERDCMLWIRSKEVLKADEKQYGPWLRAPQERLQQLQLVMAVRNKGDGGQPVGADSENGGMVDRPPIVREKMVSGDLGKANGKGDVDACMGHMEGLTNAGTAGEEHIPKIMQIMDFEEQLNDIDRAIGFGEKNTEWVTKSKERNDLKAESQDHNTNALPWGGGSIKIWA